MLGIELLRRGDSFIYLLKDAFHTTTTSFAFVFLSSICF
jgi:hypothetical protein